MTELKVFDLVNSINFGKESLMRGDQSEEAEKVYNPYLTNMALSYFIDTILYANLMNQHYHLDGPTQYEFLFNAVRKKKRFSKWHKPENVEDLDFICDHYQVNKTVGREYISLLSTDEIENLKQLYNTGGTVNARK